MDLANFLRDLELCPWAKRDIDEYYKSEETTTFWVHIWPAEKERPMICLLSAKVSKRLLFSCFMGVNLVRLYFFGLQNHCRLRLDPAFAYAEARSRLCVCRASFLMTFVTSGMPHRLPAATVLEVLTKKYFNVLRNYFHVLSQTTGNVLPQ